MVLNMKNKIALIVFCISVLLNTAMANNDPDVGEEGIVRGKVMDQKTKKPVEYATVAIYKKEDNSVVTGTISDENGEFKIKGLDPGEFYIVISFLGYDDKKYDNLVIKQRRSMLDLGMIVLGESSEALDEVEVVADRQSVEFKIDKKIVSVGKQMTSASLSAVEVLENVPSIRVDIEGNVSLRGSTGFTVLIDGKPTVLDPSDALRQIPASTIENIEIITNPSAKYQPDGTGGIINIITKKNRMQGVQGMINVKGGNYNQYGGDALLNWRKKKLNFYVGGDYNHRPFPGESYNERMTISDGDTTNQVYFGDSDRTYSGGSFRTGLDWDITAKDFFSMSFRTGSYERVSESDLKYSTTESPDYAEEIEYNNSESNRNGTYYSLTGNYQKKFDENGHELTAQLNYRYRDSEEWTRNLLYDETNTAATSGTYTTEDGPSSRYELRVDYTKPVGINGRFEAGFQGRKSNSDDITSYSDYDAVSQTFVQEESLNNAINYIRDIYAIYSTYNGEWRKLGYQFGLRGEYTNREISNKSDDEKYTINRWDIFPTVHFSYQLPEENQLMTSYSRRIDRPRGYYLEPFITWTDMYNVRQGDPDIKPEYIDAIEIGYLKKWQETQLSLEAYYRITHNKIESIESVYDEGVILTTYANVGSDYSLGIDAMYNVPLMKWWDVNLMGNVYSYRVEGELDGESFDNESFNWSSRLNSTFKIKKQLQLQVDGSYNSPTVSSQGETEGYYSVNSAVRYDFMDRKMAAVLQVRDVFATAKSVSITEGDDFYSYKKWTREAPYISLTLSYRINNFLQKRKNGDDSNGGVGDDEF
jgi:outer membrane receptor protein involved in Fe transport